jgi:NAD-dependent deacetylase
VLKDLKTNPAHETIARWQNHFADFTLATQNIDGLHAAAGSRGVLELHGNVWTARCTGCGARADLRVLDAAVRPPVCAGCGEPMRPDVVLFGEMPPRAVFELASRRAAESDVCIVVGTSALVYPAANLPEVAKFFDAFLVEVNPERTPLSRACDAVIGGRAGEVLPQLDSR